MEGLSWGAHLHVAVGSGGPEPRRPPSRRQQMCAPLDVPAECGVRARRHRLFHSPLSGQSS
eukprot:13149382-Alexandrium_andersonii.AAC.1